MSYRKGRILGAVLATGLLALVGCSGSSTEGASGTAATPATSAAASSTASSSSASASATSSAAASPTASSSSASSSAGPTSSGAAGSATYEDAECPNPIFPGAPALDLGPEFECGYLTVPEDREDPSSPTIRIAVARVAAQSATPAPDPIVYLTGGPGGSGLIGAPEKVAAGWNADRDVIFLDQRGSWKSDPLLACPEIDEFLATWIGLNTFDPATATASGEAAAACRERIVAEGWDPADYNTTENAADIADLRVALGIDEWNVYGVSYGSDLALQTLRNHPEGIRSVVVDSQVPPQTPVTDFFWESAAYGYNTLFTDCANEAACAAAYPNLRADFDRMVAELTTTPRTVAAADPAGTPVDVVIDGYKLANLVLLASLRPGAISPVPAMIDNLANGDGSQAAAALAAGAPPPGVTGYALALGVFCGESVAFSSVEQMRTKAEAALPEFPAEVLSLAPQAPFLFSDCEQWDVPAADPAVAEPAVSDVPVLVLGGELDAITAVPNGESVIEAGLSSATLVKFPDAGHDVMIWSTECAVTVLNGFLNDPEGFDQSCVAALTPPTFGGS